MGLFIGASLLTILEILDYLCEVGQNPRCDGRNQASSVQGGVCWPPIPVTCPQVFQDRVLGYFWNRRSSQRRSRSTLVRVLSPSPTPSTIGLTPDLKYLVQELSCATILAGDLTLPFPTASGRVEWPSNTRSPPQPGPQVI